MAPRRLPPRAREEPRRELAFRWGRRRVVGQEGDTVASALLAAGHGILARSVKYHRPRGVLCGVGACPNCLVGIDGSPSERACMVPLRAGMRVEPQNCWPGPRLDLFGVVDRLFPRGFDPQRAFTRPRFLVPLYHMVVRRMAGLGRLHPCAGAAPPAPAPLPRERARLVVVGAGPAGMAAALEAARAGIAVRCYDERPWPGGRLALEAARLGGSAPFGGLTPHEASLLLEAELRAAGCAPVPQATVAGLYPGRVLAVRARGRLLAVEAEAVVLATGAPEALPLFGDNDRPGIVSASAALVLLRRHRVLPGERAVILGADARALEAARALAEAGASVETLVALEPPEADGFPLVRGEPVRALGSRRVRGVEVATPHGTRRLACDLLVYAEPRRPSVELAQQAGAALAVRGGVLAPRAAEDGATVAPGVFAAGDLLAPGSLDAALASGRLAGMLAARALGAGVPEARLAEARETLAKLGGAA